MMRRPSTSVSQMPSQDLSALRHGVDSDWCRKCSLSASSRARVAAPTFSASQARRSGERLTSPSDAKSLTCVRESRDGGKSSFIAAVCAGRYTPANTPLRCSCFSSSPARLHCSRSWNGSWRSAALPRRTGGDVAYRGPTRSPAPVHARTAAHYMIIERLARRRGVTGCDLGDDIAVLAREHRQRTALRKRLSPEQVQLVDQAPVDGHQLAVA